ncbi:MAG: SPFH domain-containing protein [Desulfobacterales bacterium]|jgi:membrane protease subunit (stomatin/prohibitin family)
MAIIDVVKWNASDETYAWKFPSEELSTWTQLIVSETQEAMLLNEGQMLGPFKPGRHTLDTKNYPVISKFFKIPLGEKTPFTAEVWYVNKQMTLDVKWGTAYPIQLQDPKYKIMLPIRAFGQYGIQIINSKKFLKKLVGTLPVFDREKLVSYFRGLILTRAKNAIAKQIIKEKISILEISAYLNDISSSLESDMTSRLDKYGIKLINFFVKSINTPEDDPAVVKLKDALAKRAEMDIVGFNYQQERSYDTLETAAGNPGSGQADLMGAGIGLGMGMGMGGAMGGAMGQMAQGLQLGGHHCSECNSVIQPGAKFCSSCGKPSGAKESKDKKTKGVVCDKCGTEAPQGSNFCPKCGDPFICCPKCGTDNPEGSLKCIECNEHMPQTCKKCGEMITGNYTFCPKCGNQIVKKCPGCKAELKPEMMFCPECGKPSPSKES